MTAPRRRRPDPGLGALPPLIVYVLALLAIPSALIVKPLGAAGTPAQIIAIGLFGWWTLSRLLGRGVPTSRTNPVKWLMLIFCVAILASYVAGMSRPIAYVAEINSADRALLSLCAWCGVVLVMTDGLITTHRLLQLLRVVTVGVTGIAVLGIIQFVFHVDLTTVLKVPGLTANHEYGEIIGRSKYYRVTGTTTHPIEFGVVLSSTLPLAIHFARFAKEKKHRRRWWLCVFIIAAALPMSVARSGALGAAIALIYLFYTWPNRLKVQALVIGGIGALAMSVAVPGLLGTIRGLFLNASSDPSTQGRTADYAPIIHYVSLRPIFGQGIGTYIPSIYRTLDNAYLGFVAEAGIVGLLAMIGLFVGCGFVASSIRRHSRSEPTRDLAQSLKAGLAVLAVNAATFDAFGFAMCAGMIFLFIGSIGALWAISSERAPAAVRTPMPVGWLRAGAIAVVVCFLAGGFAAFTAKGVYQAYGTILVSAPVVRGQPITTSSIDTAYTASALNDIMGSRIERDKLRQQYGVDDYEVALKGGSLVAETDNVGELDATLYFVATASNPTEADRELTVVMAQSDVEVLRLQNDVGVAASAQFRAAVLQKGQAFEVRGRRSRAAAGYLVLAIVLAASAFQIRRRRLQYADDPDRPAATRPASRELTAAST